MTYKIDSFRFLARCSTLFGQANDKLAQCRDNVTGHGAEGHGPDMILDVARTDVFIEICIYISSSY